MTGIKTIPTDELRNDLAASMMEQRTFERLLPGAPEDKRPEMRLRIGRNAQIVTVIKAELERRETAVLIACSKKKRTGRRPAAELYDGDLFKAQMAYARALGMDDEQIFIVSANYGLVRLGQELDPYDLILAQRPAQERRQWGAVVVRNLLDARPEGLRKVILLAGKVYREAIEPDLREYGIGVDTAVPSGLGYGQQVAWYQYQVAWFGKQVEKNG